MSAAETHAWHESEMQEIYSMLCRYMRVMLRGRAKTVENGRVRPWVESGAPRALADSPLFSVEVAVRRVAWLQAMLRDETNHAQPLDAIFGAILGERGS